MHCENINGNPSSTQMVPANQIDYYNIAKQKHDIIMGGANYTYQVPSFPPAISAQPKVVVPVGLIADKRSDQGIRYLTNE